MLAFCVMCQKHSLPCAMGASFTVDHSIFSSPEFLSKTGPERMKIVLALPKIAHKTVKRSIRKRRIPVRYE